MLGGLDSKRRWLNEVWHFGAGETALSLPIIPRLRVNTAESAVAAAVAGGGIARLLCYQIAEARAAGQLKTILTAYEPASIPVQLVHVGQAILPLKLLACLNFAARRLRIALHGLRL